MSSLNILCAICSEFYTNTDNIYVTGCGHVFHQQCLFHWLRESHTCPQCRQGCLRHKCRKIFLNFELPREEDACSGLTAGNNSFYEWISIDRDMNDDINTFALHYGTEENGHDIYAARGYYNGDLVPAYYCPKRNGVILPWGFKSHHLMSNIEILDISCDNAEYKWVSAANGDLPDNALVTGHTVSNEPLYSARTEQEGRALYGKLHRRYNAAYVPYGDEELCNPKYEVLVRIPKSQKPCETKQ